MPKIIKVGGNLTKVWQNNFAEFLRHGVCTSITVNHAYYTDFNYHRHHRRRHVLTQNSEVYTGLKRTLTFAQKEKKTYNTIQRVNGGRSKQIYELNENKMNNSLR